MRITKDKVLLAYQLIVMETGGTLGIRDESLLESAIEAPYQTFDGKELFPSKIEKAARLGYGLVSNHPFVDGNKRIGINIMLSFIKSSGIEICLSDSEITFLAMNIASGKFKYEDVLEFLKSKEITHL